jgi:predicted 2-oxoglutarate/Fe(II)-dependent dioxygenase YbiX
LVKVRLNGAEVRLDCQDNVLEINAAFCCASLGIVPTVRHAERAMFYPQGSGGGPLGEEWRHAMIATATTRTGEMSMPGICEELAKLLSTVRRPGDFFASGRIELLPPRLTVKGVGQIALPLLPVQAEQLVALAERAPYGRGAATTVDTNVRRSWQIGPDRVRLDGKHWQATLDRAVALATEGLGVDEPITAEFYKLLIYDEGSFFVSHRDTEKAPGMFATLVLALPSLSSGGQLVVRHKEREVRLDVANDDPSEMTFAAFYADCLHEVLPITAGCRATLIYNLMRKGKGSTVKPPDYEAETARAAALLREWGESKTGQEDGKPEKVVYPLDHAYSLAELDFANLKGVDAAVAALLKSAAPQAACDLHLALVSIEESGSADYNVSYHSHYDGYDDDDDEDEEEFEVGEVHERHECLTEWRSVGGEPVTLGTIPIETGEVAPPDAFDDMTPDEQHFHEATGNAGASFERTYRHAAFVLWPRQRRLAVLNQAGTAATMPYLETLATKWINEGAQQGSAHWIEAHELSGYMLDTWPKGRWYHASDDEDDEDDETDGCMADDKPSLLARLVAALTTLKDETRIAAALSVLTARRGHSKSDNGAILAAVALFPPERAAGMVEAIIASHASGALASCCALMKAAIAAPFAAKPEYLAAAAKGLIASLPGDPARAPKPVDPWTRRIPVRPGPGVITDLVGIAEPLDAELARQLAEHLLAWPKTYDIDRALVPAVKHLLEGGARRSGPATTRLLAACLAHLETRAAEPLEPPRNWSRANDIRCKCEHCTALRRFLASPDSENWTLKAREQVRGHVEDEITKAHADLDVSTERRGSPHRLVCRKNSASYERRVAQRRRDLADIAVLKEDDGSLPGDGPLARSRHAQRRRQSS